MKRYTLPAPAVTVALLFVMAASASASIFDVQSITVTRGGSLNIFMTAACGPTHDRFLLTATVRQRTRHHTLNEVTVGTEQLGVCDPSELAVYPFWHDGLCGSPVPPPEGPCLIGTGFRPGRATVEWSGSTFSDPEPGLPPADETGTKQVVIRPAWAARARAGR
jgi:hypothetical protein